MGWIDLRRCAAGVSLIGDNLAQVLDAVFGEGWLRASVIAITVPPTSATSGGCPARLTGQTRRSSMQAGQPNRSPSVSSNN
jgi:hypothetical protein